MSLRHDNRNVSSIFRSGLIVQLLVKFQFAMQIIKSESYETDNFDLNELKDLAEAYVGPLIDPIYRRVVDRDFAPEDPDMLMLLATLTNILGHDNRGDRPTEVLMIVGYGKQGVLDCQT